MRLAPSVVYGRAMRKSRKFSERCLVTLLALWLSFQNTSAQEGAIPLPPPSVPTFNGPPSFIPGGPVAPIGGVPGLPRTPTSNLPTSTEDFFQRIPDPTTNFPLSPEKTDVGGLFVPNLLPGITGDEFRNGARPQKLPGGLEPQEGFYYSQDILIVRPNFKGTMQVNLTQLPWSAIPLGNNVPNTNFVFPEVGLEWTATPTFDFGYILPGGQGEFAFNYQFLVAQGSGTGTFLDLPSTVQSRIAQNEIDLLYRSPYKQFSPKISMNYEIGIKLGFFYYDTTANPMSGGRVVGVGHASNYFFGGGPRFRYDLEHTLTENRRWIFWHGAEITTVMGQINQSFSNTVPGYPFTVNSGKSTNTVPILKLQTGVQWTPPMLDKVFIRAGLEWDEYWRLGQLGQSSGILENFGIYLQGRYDF